MITGCSLWLKIIQLNNDDILKESEFTKARDFASSIDLKAAFT